MAIPGKTSEVPTVANRLNQDLQTFLNYKM
jgi:hypothetical protein